MALYNHSYLQWTFHATNQGHMSPATNMSSLLKAAVPMMSNEECLDSNVISRCNAGGP